MALVHSINSEGNEVAFDADFVFLVTETSNTTCTVTTNFGLTISLIAQYDKTITDIEAAKDNLDVDDE